MVFCLDDRNKNITVNFNVAGFMPQRMDFTFSHNKCL